MTETETVICQILTDLTGVSGIGTGPEWSLFTGVPDGLGLDDLDYVEMLMRLETHYGIRLDLDHDYGDTVHEIAIAIGPYLT